MPQHLKVLLDENISSPRALAIIDRVLELPSGKRFQAGGNDTPPADLVFLADFMEAYGVNDAEWVPQAADAAFDLVITTDQGRKKRGDKLPELCEKYCLTHVLVTAPVKARGIKFITMALLGVWTNLIEAIGDSCLRFKLHLQRAARSEVGEHRLCLSRNPRKPARG